MKKSQKHDVNLQKNSTLYFQVGLILCLLASYTALEMTFASTANDLVYNVPDLDDNSEPDEKIYEVEKVKTKKPIRVMPKDPVYEPVKNDTPERKEELVAALVTPVDYEPTNKEPLDVNSLIVEAPPETVETIMTVQKVPIYPGCERKKNNVERRKCMSDKLGKLVQKKFDTDLGEELGLSGLQKIDIFFKINKQGEVVILRTRAPHPALDKEAKRIVGKIPTIQPGMNNNKPVEVSYNLPVRFNVQN